MKSAARNETKSEAGREAKIEERSEAGSEMRSERKIAARVATKSGMKSAARVIRCGRPGVGLWRRDRASRERRDAV